MSVYPNMVDIVPEGQTGVAAVEHFEIDEQAAKFSGLRAAIGHPLERVSAGRYAKLLIDGKIVMSDTDMERDSNCDAVWHARGRVLIAGLGLGMILHPIARNLRVKSVTVVEKSADVIRLVGPTVPPMVKIAEADIFEWCPPEGSKFDTIYFDIWGGICADNLREMKKLHAKFRKHLTRGGWMDSWMREELKTGGY